jgi:site-specific recombinase
MLSDAQPAESRSARVRARALEQALLRVDVLVRAASLAARLDALEALVLFLRTPDPGLELLASESNAAPLPAAHRRLALCIGWLERSPDARAAFCAAMTRVCADLRGLSLFAEAGLANDRGLSLELADRVARRVLPRPRADRELTALVPRLFPDAAALDWLTRLPCALFERTLALLPAAPAWQSLRTDLEEALCLLATRIAALGFAEEMRERRSAAGVRDSPYHRIARSTDRWLCALDAYRDPLLRSEEPRSAGMLWTGDAAACRSGNEEVRAHLTTSGVSVAVVYGLDLIERLLERMELLFQVLATEAGSLRASAIQQLCGELVRGRLADRSLRSLLRENLGLLARKVIERTGNTGEHYITTTLHEWLGMLRSAAGGGLLTTGTAIFKLVVAQAHWPILVDFALAGSNYALSFIAIQLCGFTLATKQPALTAAALAAVLEQPRSPPRSEALAIHVARIVRSQLAAASANIVAVALGAVLFESLWSRWRGAAWLAPDAVDYVLRSLDPLASGTIGYAILTGALLWMSGLAAGWVGNWVVYRRLPLAIAEHRLGDRIGPQRMQRAARWFATNVSGFGGSIALGFLLAAVPALGRATGLPLDVRHVTLSTGQLVLAAATLGSDALHDPRVRSACVGIAVIFVLNLSTSFLLALAVAARARNATLADMRDLGSALAHRLAHRPLEFVFPPRVGMGE